MLFKLIKYELKKLCTSVFFIVLLVLFLLVNTVLCYRFARMNTEHKLLYQGYLDKVYELYMADSETFYAEYEEAKAHAKEMFANKKRVPGKYGTEMITDKEIFETVLEYVNMDEDFHKEISALIVKNKFVVKNAERTGKTDNYKYHYTKHLIETYTNINEKVNIEPEMIRGWNELFTYELDFYLVLILVAVCCVSIATNDRKNGFYAVAGTCKHGRGASAVAKYVSLLIMIVFLVLIFTLTNIITVGIVCDGYSSPFNAVHAIDVMDAFPYALNILETQIILYFLRFAAMASFALALFALSVIVKNQILCFGTAFIVFLANYFIYLVPSYEYGDWKHLGLLSLYFPDEFIVSYRSFNFFGDSVNLVWVFIITMILILVISLALTLIFYSMRTSSKFFKPLNFLRKLKFKKRTSNRASLITPRGILSFELYKYRAIVILLIVLLVGKTYTAIKYYDPLESAYDRFYKLYIEEIGGEYSEEKAEYIKSEEKHYNKIKGQLDSMQTKFFANEISSKEYNAYMDEYMVAEVKLDVLSDLSMTARRLAKLYEEKGILASFVYETGYQAHAYRGADLILLLFVVFFASRLYLYENEKSISGTPMDVVNRTSKRGRLPLYSRKYLLCIGVSLICALLFGGIDWFFLLRKYQMPDMSASILSIGIYADAPNISIMQYTILSELLGIIGTILTALLAFCAGSLLKRSILTYAIAAAFVVVPYYAAANGGRVFALTDTTKLQNTDALFRTASKTGTVPTVVIFFAIFTAILIFLTLFSARRVKKGV